MLTFVVVVPVVILTVFHPEVACCFACFLGFVFIVVFVSRCVVANALMFVVVVVMLAFVVIVIVIVVVVAVVAVVMGMVVSSGHGGHGHGEGLHVFCFELEDVLALFKVVNGHHGFGRTVASSG